MDTPWLLSLCHELQHKLTFQHDKGQHLWAWSLPGTSPDLERTEGEWGNFLQVTVLVLR